MHIKQRTALKRWQLKLSHGINNDTEYLREVNFISWNKIIKFSRCTRHYVYLCKQNRKGKKLLQNVITGDDGYVRWNSAPLKLFRSNIHSGIRLFVEQKDTAYYTKNPPIFQGELLFLKKFGFEKVWLFAHMHLLKESRCELTPSFNCWTCVLTFSPPISSTSLKVINSLPHRSTARSRL